MPIHSLPIKSVRVLLLGFFVLLLSGCGGGGGSGGSGSGGLIGTPPGTLKLALQAVATGLDSPVFLTAPAGDARLFIVERSGKIRIVQNATLLTAPFLDISNRTTTDNERGLLSMAFHPQFATNGFFFVFYTDVFGDLVIERFSAPQANANVANLLSGLRILTIPHPTFGNHNGGLVAFGPDGFLYVGTGDGGGAGDPFGNAQNTNSLLGKLLRIDVNAATVAQPYTIPLSNPFINQTGTRPEIWAYGLRNPWRYAFDATLLYIADVGQNRREEVDVAGVGQAGLNYGWNITEGTLCFPGDPCNRQGITLPIFEYDHSNNRCSITGGYVYRGTAIPEVQGRYFYSDFCAGQLQSFLHVNGTATEQKDWGIQNIGPILSFGEDAQRELYLLSGNGTVFRIVRE
ncbi:MAG: PQQ-dependent sugar dehydrogenase [Oxalobacteraceae bacterium]|nr:PQQ-dependent sugar dehydrogenase [Oxalobacteraceae bacterium]